MNLVCYEYIAARKQSQGKVLVSEFAGDVEGQGGCVLLNLWELDEIVHVIYKATCIYTYKAI
jgi:trehalose-6-phosphate synthase